MAGISDFFSGTPARTEQQSLLTGPQQGLQNQAIQQLMSMLGQGQGGSFDPIEKQARTNFQTQTIPGLAERFTSLGGEGGQRSSAFQGALGQAGAGLEQNLAALKSQHQTNQFGQLAGLAGQKSFENSYFPRQPGIGEQILPGLAAILPAIGSIAGGPIGGAIGAAGGGLATLIQSLISGRQGGNPQQSPESIPQSMQQQVTSRLGNYEQSAMNPNLNTLAQAVPQQGGIPQGINLGTLAQLQQPQGLNYAGQPYDRQTILQHQQQEFNRNLIDKVSLGLPKLMEEIGSGRKYMKPQAA